MNTQPTFSVHYSSDEHDEILTTSNSLFESTCEFYYMLDDLEESEWVTLIDEDYKVLKISE